MTITDLAGKYHSGELSPVREVEQALARLRRLQPSLNAFITVLADSALEAARESEARHARHQPLSPLDGIPIGIKDLVQIAGVPTTAASKVLAGQVAERDAPVIQRLRAAGAILLGTTNLHEFAYGPTGDVSFYGPVRNPWKPAHIAGGSSSGSAVAVAAGICPMALGSDSGGSIRIPASMCGIVGLKPTYGLVSCDEVIPLSWSLDHLGPIASTVEDCGVSLAAMSDFQMPHLGQGRRHPFRIGLVRELFFDNMDADVRKLAEAALPELGEVHEVDIPHIRLAPAVVNVIMASEALAYHRRWLEERPGDYQQAEFSVPNRLRAGFEVKAIDYVQATRARQLLIEEMSAALAEVDVLAMPTLPIPAPELGQYEVRLENGTAVPAGIITRNTAPINLTGFPAISVPCGFTSTGLPAGLQLVARPWEEARLLQVAYHFEARTHHQPMLPEV